MTSRTCVVIMDSSREGFVKTNDLRFLLEKCTYILVSESLLV